MRLIHTPEIILNPALQNLITDIKILQVDASSTVAEQRADKI
jgi:hypothetical protein